IPIRIAIEDNPDPTAPANVGRHEEMLGIAAYEDVLRTKRRRDPRRVVRGSVVIRIHREKGALAHEERGLAVTEAFARVGQCETDRADPREQTRLFARGQTHGSA